MAEARQTVERPLSPHLSIYRPLINMVMSILHRLTGAALYFGTLLLAAWLIAAAMGEAQFDYVNALFAHPIGKLILFGYTWSLLHHLCSGIRYFFWDLGYGFGANEREALTWGALIAGISLTVLIWIIAYTGAGK